MRLANKVAVVIGAGQSPGEGVGNGRATVLRFAQEGAKVWAVDRDLASAKETAALVVAEGGACEAHIGDVTSEASLAAAIAACHARWGRVDILHYNVGVSLGGGDTVLADFTEEAFDRLCAINLRGCFLGIKAVGAVIRSGGSVIVTASSAGLAGFTEGPSYAASKHGVVGLVRSASHPFAQKGLRINAICPGGVATGMMVAGGVPDNDTPPDQFAPIPYRAPAASEHIAEVALFLASSRSAFMNGAAYAVDGGLTSSFGIPEDSPNKPR